MLIQVPTPPPPFPHFLLLRRLPTLSWTLMQPKAFKKSLNKKVSCIFILKLGRVSWPMQGDLVVASFRVTFTCFFSNLGRMESLKNGNSNRERI